MLIVVLVPSPNMSKSANILLVFHYLSRSLWFHYPTIKRSKFCQFCVFSSLLRCTRSLFGRIILLNSSQLPAKAIYFPCSLVSIFAVKYTDHLPLCPTTYYPLIACSSSSPTHLASNTQEIVLPAAPTTAPSCCEVP